MRLLLRSLGLAVAGMAIACAARADPPTSVLITQTMYTLSAATDKTLDATGAGIRMLCVQNVGANPVTLAFDAAAVAGSGYLLSASGGVKCWDSGTVPRNVLHAISTAGSTLAVLVGR